MVCNTELTLKSLEEMTFRELYAALCKGESAALAGEKHTWMEKESVSELDQRLSMSHHLSCATTSARR